jgi:hypothetical protein
MMTDRPFIGIFAALIVEIGHWSRFRWEFEDEACSRTWQFNSIAIAVAAALIWLDGSRYTALPVLLSWMPPLLLPMQFIQSYGMRNHLPLNAFSFLARQHRERSRRHGLIEETTVFNFGNVLFATTLVASCVGARADSWMFLPGIVILTGWIMLAAGRSSALALIPVLILAGLLGLAGQFGLERAEEWFGRSSGNYAGRFDPNFKSTLIGTSGTVVQSNDIVWRIRSVGTSPPPKLLRSATFNTYIGSNWQNQRVAASDFQDVDSTLVGERGFYLLQEARRADKLADLPQFTLRGAASAESPLPLPGDVSGLSDFELDGIERNSFGTVRIYPKQSVIDGTVFWRGGTNPENPPIATEDLRIPLAEKKVIHGIVSELQLDSQPSLNARLAILRAWFSEHFRYTRRLTIQRLPRNRSPGYLTHPTAIARFLSEVRAGHCEYFATAATLILRDAGIPTRYSTGHAVIERDLKRGGYILRGTHGHAWCRVWDEASSTWIDFDPTPSNWFASIATEDTAMQRFNDGLKRLREDFFIWRSRPANRLAVSLVMTTIGLGLTAFIIKRLWKSKRRLETRALGSSYDGPAIITPLHRLEPQASKHLGPRPPGQPFGHWLTHLRATLGENRNLDEAIALHQRLRFDPSPAPPDQHERLTALTRMLEAALKEHRTSNVELPTSK